MKCKLIREGFDFDDVYFKWDVEESGFVQLDALAIKAVSETSVETKNEELKEVLRRIYVLSLSLDKRAIINGFLVKDLSITQGLKPDSRRTAANRRFKLALELEYITEDNGEFKLNI
jgi:hypothetical protein